MNKEIIDKILQFYKKQDSEENNIVNKVALGEYADSSELDTLSKSVQKRKVLSEYNNIYYSEEIVKNLIDIGYIGVAKLKSEVSGGNCYSQDDSGLRTNNYEITDFNFDLLDSILEIVKPSITYLEFKKLEKELIKLEEFTEYEYYGNSRTYLVKTVSLNKLFSFLKVDLKLEFNPVGIK